MTENPISSDLTRRKAHQASMRYEMGLNLLPGHSYGEHDLTPSRHDEIEGGVIAEYWLTDDARVEIRPPSTNPSTTEVK